MTSDPNMNNQEIIAYRQSMKAKYGPKSEWPDFVRERYEQMKDENRSLREFA